jgi:uncharacterized tellurite resistance protein B-like protein
MSQQTVEREWSFLGIISYLYILLMHSDGEQHESEVDTFVKKVSEWNVPGCDGPDDIVNAYKIASQYLLEDLRNKKLIDTVEMITSALKSNASENIKVSIIADLIHIAEADGKVSDQEKSIINIVRNRLGL